MVALWIVTAAVMFGLYNVFIKISAEDINPILGAVVLQFVAAFLGLALLLVTQVQSGSSLPFWTGRGLLLATLAGIAIGLVEILAFFIYGRGVTVAVGNPLIVGGSLIVTTGIGVLLLRESISVVQTMAIALIAGGVLLLAWSAARA
jgi:transporter family protein